MCAAVVKDIVMFIMTKINGVIVLLLFNAQKVVCFDKLESSPRQGRSRFLNKRIRGHA